jgi:hypothetical protein
MNGKKVMGVILTTATRLLVLFAVIMVIAYWIQWIGAR